jgi:WD40 repeat protein
MDSFEQLFVLQGDGGYVNALDFSADDHRLFSGSNDGKHLIVITFGTHIDLMLHWRRNGIQFFSGFHGKVLFAIPRIFLYRSLSRYLGK